MTSAETTRAALQKALEALDSGSCPVMFFEHGDDVSAKVDFWPARLAIEQALAEIQAEEPPAAMDEKALEIANRLTAAIVQDMPIARYKELLQVALLEAMQWMRSQERERSSTADKRRMDWLEGYGHNRLAIDAAIASATAK